MKRKILAMMMLMVFAFLLAGCDLFGGGKTTTVVTTQAPTTTQSPTTTQAPTTTQSPTTTQQSTTIQQSTTTQQTTAQDTYYSVVFLDGDGSTLTSQSVISGGAATAPSTTPTKTATAQYTFTFDHWDATFTNVTSDLVVNPVFTETVNEYTVTFVDYDGTTLQEESVPYGSEATAPDDPEREGTDANTFTFDHWDGSFSYITENVTITAVYEQSFNVYFVIFYDYDGTKILGEGIGYGADGVAPADPYRPSDGTNAYTFTGWDTDFTNVTEDLDVTATYMAVPLGLTYEVRFYDAVGNVIATEIVNHGDDAPDPGLTPTKESDQQYSYTFVGWNRSLTNVDKDLDIYPNFQEAFNQYTVTFYDSDGTVLSTQTVDYGDSATAPADQSKPDDTEYSYTFIGWDANYAYVTGDLEVHPEFFATPLGTFDRTDLINLTNEMFGNPDNPDYNVEDQINEMKTVMGTDSEEELYTMMLKMQQLMGDLQNVHSAGDLQELFMATQTLGFDRNTVIEILYNLMLNGFTNDLGYATENIQNLNDNITQLNADIAQNESEMNNMRTQVSDYCDAQTNPTLCQSFFDDQIATREAEESYYDMFDYDFPEVFNYDTYYNMENKLDDYLYAEYSSHDSDAALGLLNELNAMKADLTTEEMAMYQPLLDAFETWKIAEYTFENTDYSALYVLDNTGEEIIADHLNNVLWGYTSGNNWMDGYSDYINDREFDRWQIIENQMYLEDAQSQLNDETALLNYMTSDDGEIETKTALGTLYDGLAAVIDSLDEEMFQMVMNTIMSLQDNFDSNTYKIKEPQNPLEMYKDILNPDNIVLLSDKLSTILNAFMSTMDAADYANIKEIAIGFFSEKMAVDGASDLQIQAFVTILDPMIDRYITYAQFAVGQVQSFLESVDHAKAEVMLSVFSINFMSEPNDIDTVIKASKIINGLIGDGSVDVSQILQYMAAIYFDVTNEMYPNASDVTRIQGEIDTFVSDTLALIDVVKDYNPNVISPAEVENVMEVFARAQAIVSWFDKGFEAVEDPLVVYDDMYLNGFLSYVLGEYDVDAAIAKYKDILGTTDNEMTYYELRSIFQYVVGVMKVEKFSDIQDWVNNLESFGFTQEELISYFANLVEMESDNMGPSNDNFQQILEYLIYDLMNNPTYKADTEEVLGIVLDDLQNMITSMPSNSFPMIEQLIGYMKGQMQGPMDYPTEPENKPMDFMMTPAQIYQLTQEISTFLKLRGDTFTADDITTLENFITTAVTLYVNNLDLDSTEAADMITYINTLVTKYIGFADVTLTQVTNFLDGLTLNDVEMLMNFIQSMNQGGDNIYTNIISGAQLISSMIDPAEVDLHLLANMLNEVYFDQMYGDTYDPADLVALQTAWEGLIDEAMTQINAAALLDPYNLDPSTFPALYELQQRVAFLAYIFIDPEAALSPPDFGYSNDDLVNLVMDMFYEVDSTTVDAKIQELCDIFNIDILDSDQMFFIIYGIGSVMTSVDMENIHSVTDIVTIFNGLTSLGYTNQEMATYVINAFMIYVYPDLPNMYDTTQIENDLLYATDQFDYYQQMISDLEVDIAGEIALIPDADAQVAAWQLWEDYKAEVAAASEYYNLLQQDGFQDMFDNYLFQQLQGYVVDNQWDDVWNTLNDMPTEQYQMYSELLNKLADLMQSQNDLETSSENFVSMYGYYMNSYGQAFDDYFLLESNNYFGNYYDHMMNFERQMYDMQDELNRIQDNAWFFQTLEGYFSDPANEALAVDALTIVLDQLDAYAQDPNIDSFDFLLSMIMMEQNPFDVGAETLSPEIINIGTFIGNMFSTIDPSDEAILQNFLDKMVEAYVDTLGITDSTELQNTKDAYVAMVNLYFSDVMDLPGYVSTSLQSMTADKVQALLDQIAILNTLPSESESTMTQNYIRVVAIATIIDTLVGDGSLDYDSIVTTVFSLAYDLNTLNGVTFSDTLANMLPAALAQLDTLIIQADVVSQIDPLNPSILDQANLQTMFSLIDGLGQYFTPIVGEQSS